MNKKAGLTDIARLANVSIATVSYALNDSPEVSEKTRAKIKDIATKLNYSPNKIAQGLRTHQSHLIGMLINTFNSMFNGELVDDIRAELDKNGYSLLVIGDSNKSLINSNLFDGLIVFNYTTTQKKLLSLINQSDIPIVVMANELEQKNVHNVVVDNRNAITHLAKYFVDSTHRDICFLRGSQNSYNSVVRYKSCLNFFKNNFPDIDVDSNTFNCSFESHAAYRTVLPLLKERKYNFFFCLNDMMAYGVYRAANELQLKIGTDISIVGFDNSPKSGEIYLPKLVTVDSHLLTWSHTVVESLTTRLKTKDALTNDTTYIPTSIVHGDSVNLIKSSKS